DRALLVRQCLPRPSLSAADGLLWHRARMRAPLRAQSRAHFRAHLRAQSHAHLRTPKPTPMRVQSRTPMAAGYSAHQNRTCDRVCVSLAPLPSLPRPAGPQIRRRTDRCAQPRAQEPFVTARDLSMTAPAPAVAIHTDLALSSGLIQPSRSALVSDAPRLDLCGSWRFRLSPSVPGEPGGAGVLPAGEASEDFTASDYDDAACAQIQVPAHWVLQGQGAFGRPIYTNVQYPFAIDPPHVPDENPTGDYRREFTIEDQWLDAGRVLLRFDGVESFFQLWVNGAPVGSAS